MPKTTTPRNGLPVPYSLDPSPLSGPSPRSTSSYAHRGMRPPAAAASSSSGHVSSSNSDSMSVIWKSIESLLLSQKAALEAQSAKLVEISSSMERRLDRIHDAQKNRDLGFGKELEELKALVKGKREEGFRFGEEEWEKLLGIGWAADRGHGIGLDRDIRSERGGCIGDHDGGDGELRFEELIDMSRFEDLGSSDSHPHPTTLNPAKNYGDFNITPNSIFPESIIPENEASQVEDRPIEANYKQATSVAQFSAPPESTNAIAGSSRLPGSFRPRADSVASLSSGIESLPETDTRHSRAGSNITDILSGINTYLERPTRRRISRSPPPPKPILVPEHRLRKRTKQPIYSSKWHPMDSTRKQLRLEDEAREAADAANEEERSVRGLSTAPRTYLPASDGQVREGGKDWWKWGANTLIGRMQDISCDLCRGRAHWTCAGLSQYDDMSQESWFCPDCYTTLDSDPNTSPQPVPQVQQERCIRPDCIRRSKRSVYKRPGDQSRHVVERIIGIKSRRVNGTKRCEYLSKWEGWEMYESTWQDPSSFDDGVTNPENQFLTQCAREGLNSQARVVLLQEAEEFWDENGDLKVDILEELGIPKAEWWPSPRGKYKVLIQ